MKLNYSGVLLQNKLSKLEVIEKKEKAGNTNSTQTQLLLAF